MNNAKMIYCACALLAAGCRTGDPDSVQAPKTLRIECADFEDSSKSVGFSDDSSGDIANVNIFVYDSSGQLVNGTGNYETYFLHPGSIDMTKLFPDYEESYSVFVLANFGRVNASLMSSREDAENFNFTYDSYAQSVSSGFPKAAIEEDFCPENSPLRIKVKRLLTRYHINIVNDSNYAFDLRSVKVRQSARNLYPFQEESAADETFGTDGDCFSDVEIGDGEGVVYVLENVRGDVFENYSNPEDRTMENLDEYDQTRSTYLEFSGKLTDIDGGLYENAVFRYFFGKEQFVGVRRNQNVEIDLKLSETCVCGDGWRKDPGDYKCISPSYNNLTFSWRGTDTFICPLYSGAFTGVQELSPTGSEPFTMMVNATVGWQVTSFPAWTSVTKNGASITCSVNYLPFGQSARSGKIVLTSNDGAVTKNITIKQNPPKSWMRFPLAAYCFQDEKSKPTDKMTITTYYDSNVSKGGFVVTNIYAVTGINSGVEDFMMKSLTSSIGISYGTVSSSGNSLLRYRHPVTISIPKATVNSLRNSAGANGCILYFDFNNSSSPLYADPKVSECSSDLPGFINTSLNTGLPRFVLRIY